MKNQLTPAQIKSLQAHLIKLGVPTRAALKMVRDSGIDLKALRGITPARARFLYNVLEWQQEKWAEYFPQIPMAYEGAEGQELEAL